MEQHQHAAMTSTSWHSTYKLYGNNFCILEFDTRFHKSRQTYISHSHTYYANLGFLHTCTHLLGHIIQNRTYASTKQHK